MHFKEEEEDSDTQALLSDLCLQLDKELINDEGNVWKANEERNSQFYSVADNTAAGNPIDCAIDDEVDDTACDVENFDWVGLAFALEEYLVYVHMSALAAGGGAAGDASSSAAATLVLKGYNVEVLLEAVILANGDVYAASSIVFAVEEMIRNMKPCRHALSGHCGRSDCRFEHNFACSPCRYWMSAQGCAQRGQSCPFSHSIQVILSGGAADDEGGSFVSSSDVRRLLGEQADGLAGAAHAYEYKEDEFPVLSGPAAGPRTQSGGRVSDKESREILLSEELYQSIFKTSYYSYNKAAKAAASVTSSQGSTSGSSRTGTTRATASFVAEWVDSGRSVRYTYAQARQDARKFALLRNSLFGKARKCYLGNKKDQAKKFSSDGQLANLQMKECHRGAARAIFSAYNPESSIRRGNFDLHGLHVSEALEILQELLELLADGDYFSETGSSHISVITGSGHHSVGGGGQARLLRKVQEYFTQMGYEYAVIRDGNHYPSGLRVKIRYH